MTDASDLSFTYDALPAHIVFGPGRRAEIAWEVERLGAQRVMMIAGGSTSSSPRPGDDGHDGPTRLLAGAVIAGGRDRC